MDRARVRRSRAGRVPASAGGSTPIRDIPELQEEEERGTFKYVPGLFKPWTFDLTMMAVDYALWDFEVWLPRSMRMEGEAGAGILKVPVTMDLSPTGSSR